MFNGLISQREAKDIHGAEIDILEASYIRFFEKIGIILQPVSNFITDVGCLIKEKTIEVVVLTGGGDVAPQYYTEYNGEVQQPNRDRIESELTRYAIDNRIPIVGICRGMQHLNGLYGGKVLNLVQINKNRPNGQDHRIIIGNREIRVNNYHNDGILKNDLSAEFSLIAVDPDFETVEGLYSEKYRLLGVQWHPERKFEEQESYEYSKNLIKSFIDNGGILDESYYIGGRTGN